MSEWMDIELWARCAEMSRPGFVFEIRNKDGQSLFTPCQTSLPTTPFDWTSGPLQFRQVPELPPEHSDPIPPPKLPEDNE